MNKRGTATLGEALGARLLREARRRAGLTQRQLAERAAVPQSTVSTYERGLRQPTLATLERLLRATGHRLRVSLAPAATDLDRNGAVLVQLLELADATPHSRRGRLRFPGPELLGRPGGPRRQRGR